MPFVGSSSPVCRSSARTSSADAQPASIEARVKRGRRGRTPSSSAAAPAAPHGIQSDPPVQRRYVVISNIVRSASLALAAGLVAIGTPAAAASPAGEDKSVVVRHGDLDLTNDNGVATLNRRIDTAARSVCGTFHAADLSARGRALSCRKVARANAVNDVELAVAAARSGQQLAANAITVAKAHP
jgi:UrcA family protein